MGNQPSIPVVFSSGRARKDEQQALFKTEPEHWLIDAAFPKLWRMLKNYNYSAQKGHNIS